MNSSIEEENVGKLIEIGMRCHGEGELNAAEQLYLQALQKEPQSFEANHLIGVLYLQKQNYEKSSQYLFSATNISGGNAHTFCCLGVALRGLGLGQESLENLEKSVNIAPDDAGLWLELGTTQYIYGKYNDAIRSLKKSIKLDESNSTGTHYYNLGSSYLNVWDLYSAVDALEVSISLDPNDANAYANLGYAQMYLSRHREALGSLKTACRLDPSNRASTSNLMFLMILMSETTTSDIYEHATQFGKQLITKASRPSTFDRAVNLNPNRRIKLGFLSPDLRDHSVGYVMRDIIGEINQVAFETFAYVPGHPDSSHLQEGLRKKFSQWSQLGGLSEAEIAQRIFDDEVDILVDLSGHTAHNRLGVFALKPAPIQVSWLGFPATTGVPGMDYFIGDSVTLPDELNDGFTEALWRMPVTSFPYAPPNESQPIKPPPIVDKGHITFGSFNGFHKLNDDVVNLWSQVLQEIPDSRLLLKNAANPIDNGLCDLMRGRFTNKGIDAERILVEPHSNRDEVWSRFGDIDVALDPFPCPGGVTTFDTLWMGVPLLSLKGNRFSSRIGASILTAIGHPELIAESNAEFISKAKQLAGDSEKISKYRSELRKDLEGSRMCDAPRFAADLEAAFSRMWRVYCGRQ